VAFANNSFEHPVADLGTRVDHIRALVDAYAVDQLASTTIAVVAFAALLLTAQMAIEFTTRRFVLENVVVDPFMTDTNGVYRLKPVTDLLGAPFLVQQPLNPGSDRFIEVGLHLGLATLYGKMLRLPGSIALQATVALQFAAYSGLMNTHNLCNVGLAMFCFHQCVDLVSLLLGKLCVDSHQCLSFLPERRVTMLPQLAL